MVESESPSGSEQLIDTAIVIKNIPFQYPEEDFVNKLFPHLGLIPPYAFNYHRNKNDRSFHGLAFANFNSPDDAQAAVDKLNNYELDRRRLRVELKKKLPAEEERQKLARQTTRRQASPQASLSLATTFQQGGIPQEIGQGSSGELVGEAMAMSYDILDPALRPKILYRGPPTPTPTLQTGILCLT